MTTKTTATTSTAPAKTEDKKDQKHAPAVYVGKDKDGNVFYTAAGSKAAKAAERAAKAAKK